MWAYFVLVSGGIQFVIVDCEDKEKDTSEKERRWKRQRILRIRNKRLDFVIYGKGRHLGRSMKIR